MCFVSPQSAGTLEVTSARAATSDPNMGRLGVGARLLTRQNILGGGEDSLGGPWKRCQWRDFFSVVFLAGCVWGEWTKVRLRRDNDTICNTRGAICNTRGRVKTRGDALPSFVTLAAQFVTLADG